jgi:cytochrome c-type biogenesis protein CcsB
MYTNFEVFFANFSFLILFLSMLIYWIQASNFTVVRAADQQTQTVTAGTTVTYNTEKTNFFEFIFKFFSYISNERNIGIVLTTIANIFLFLLLLLRWLESGHFPLSNLYESLMFLSWSLTSIQLAIEFFFSSVKNETIVRSFNTDKQGLRALSTSMLDNPSMPEGHRLNVEKAQNKQPAVSQQSLDKNLIIKLISSITAPCALFTNAFATFSLPKEMQESAPLVPALQSNWLMMHVTVMILSYAALILGSLLSIGFLVITKGENINLKTPTSVLSQLNKYNLARTLDNISYRVLGFGFPLLTIGILSGAVWANEAWGSYWSWDPKETWALLTWLVFAIYLHTRLTKGWEGQKPALIASLGFVTVWICFLGVNLIGEGLHSYGWFSS